MLKRDMLLRHAKVASLSRRYDRLERRLLAHALRSLRALESMRRDRAAFNAAHRDMVRKILSE